MPARVGRAFSLVELLAVIAIIAFLVALLMPILARTREYARSVVCRSNQRQIYVSLLMYGNENHGVVFPYDWGHDSPRELRWPVYVFKPPVWNPPVLICPSDIEPAEEHSYVLNQHIDRIGIRFGAMKGISPSDIVLLGEKRSDQKDYYLQIKDYTRLVEEYRHGLMLQANVLFLDGHVDKASPIQSAGGWDPTLLAALHN